MEPKRCTTIVGDGNERCGEPATRVTFGVEGPDRNNKWNARAYDACDQCAQMEEDMYGNPSVPSPFASVRR